LLVKIKFALQSLLQTVVPTSTKIHLAVSELPHTLGRTDGQSDRQTDRLAPTLVRSV